MSRSLSGFGFLCLPFGTRGGEAVESLYDFDEGHGFLEGVTDLRWSESCLVDILDRDVKVEGGSRGNGNGVGRYQITSFWNSSKFFYDEKWMAALVDQHPLANERSMELSTNPHKVAKI